MRTSEEDRRAATAERRRWGVFAFVIGLLIAEYPVTAAASLSHSSFTGCWLTCGGEPNPPAAALWVIVGAVFLAAPFVVGMRIARVRSWVAWAAVTILVLFAVYAWVVFSLDPANAEFYVSLGDDGNAFLDSR